ncbi:MAG: SUMF1/EgtB/PvdO family nonheme iron enzyme [Leptospiraceae bacterium]|nr:SUMF1/EgtB/PvdO family nonheme iron enzyme [Leptospiraceae bacterium]
MASDLMQMLCVPANTSGYVRGSAAVGGSATPEHTVASISAFAMARSELQYADWTIVTTWAASNGYLFGNPGVQGDNGARTDQHPVTIVSWRDAIVWCNAASERQGLKPVYFTDAAFTTPLKTSTVTMTVDTTAGSEDNPYINWSANGYRLPTEAEWEYAARYVDGTTFKPGDYASGSNAVYTSFADSDLVAWFGNIVNGSTGNTVSTQPVGQKNANALGFYDMSGNVWELTGDWYAAAYSTTSPYTDADSAGPAAGSGRVGRGGSWSNQSQTLRTAFRGSGSSPWTANNTLGFRPVRRP